MPAIIRWLSAAIPPENEGHQFVDPGGVAGGLLRSLRDRPLRPHANRWYRCAQPPANRCDPSGVLMGKSFTALPGGVSALSGGIAALNHRLIAAIPSGSKRRNAVEISEWSPKSSRPTAGITSWVSIPRATS